LPNEGTTGQACPVDGGPNLDSQEWLRALERDGFRLNRGRALDLWWSMIFSENRYPLFRIML
jgi:hypothetical protein